MLTRDGIAQIIQYYGDSRETCADALMALFKQELAARQDGREAIIEECAKVAANFGVAKFEWQSEIADAIRKLKTVDEQ